MNFARFLSIFGVLAGTSTALAQTTTVDFDTFPGGAAVPADSLITNEYPGVVFSTEARSPIANSFEALSLPNALHGDGPNAGASDIYMAFSPAVQSVEFVARGVGRRGLTVTAYSVLNAVIDTQTVSNPGTGAGISNPVSLSGAGIVRVELVQPNTTEAVESYAMDNLTFTRAAVAAVCGNGTEEAGEACDDGNLVGCDTCAADCSAVTTPGCLVGLTCFADGAPNPLNSCQACDPDASGFGFTNLANDTACDDGLFCSTGDACQAGLCVGAARSCADGLACTVDVCDEVGDDCNNTITLGCAIEGMCVAAGTTDPTNSCMACNPAVSQVAYSPVADGALCDDGAFCTAADSCSAGTCGGTALDCGDGLACTADSCDEIADSCVNALRADSCLIAGACVASAALDPTNPCLACNPGDSTTMFTNVLNGTACDDGAFCTETDSCTEGVCGGSARDCSDGLSCTLDTCDEVGDECSNELTATSCTIDGMCVADGALDPTNPCMACNAATDMNAYTPVMDGTACDDGAFCTEVDSCSAGACLGTLRTCDDMLDCTADSCAEAIGECLNVLDGGCLIDGECVPDETIDEDNACQICDPEVATTEYSPVEDGTLCSDPSCVDRTITPASTCMSATCVAAEPMECPDGVACEDGNVCAGGCTMDAQCLGDDFCSAEGVCVPDGENGEDCERANQCGSGFCAVDDGVCCDTSCSGLCQGCASGACTAHAAGTDPEDECGDQMCNGSAMCEAPAGTDAGPGMDVGPGADGGLDAGVVGGAVTGGACAASPGTSGSGLRIFGLGLLGLLIRRRRTRRIK